MSAMADEQSRDDADPDGFSPQEGLRLLRVFQSIKRRSDRDFIMSMIENTANQIQIWRDRPR